MKKSFSLYCVCSLLACLMWSSFVVAVTIPNGIYPIPPFVVQSLSNSKSGPSLVLKHSEYSSSFLPSPMPLD